MSVQASTRSATFAALLRSYRRARGLTQAELAARARISVRSLGYLERAGADHAPRRDTLRLLIQALDLPDDEAARLTTAARQVSPPPTTGEPAPAARANLLMPLTSLIGREHEKAAAIHLLTRTGARLLTLTGPAGVGKTRLALQVAATLRDTHAWPVRFVGLIPVHEPERVVPFIAQVLGILDSGMLAPRDALVAGLGDRPLVLLLDNFEQILPAAPALADLLAACPELKLLVTSRGPLNVRGEHVFAVPPLGLADACHPPPVEQLEQVPAVALFLERARAVAPEFALDPMDRAARMAQVARICQKVDGLPLAIELAAARVRHFTLDELAARLDSVDALGVLAGGARDLADHQRTMRSTIAWSYDLLAPEEQRLCRVLSVFIGGATVGALCCVAAVDAETARADLSALVDSGLARRSDHPGGSRYQLFVIVRAFAVERARAAGEWDEARRRHAEYCLALTERIDRRSVNEPRDAFERLETEYENVHAALAWARETDDNALGVRLAGGMRLFWFSRFQEGQEWLEYFIARADTPVTADDHAALAEAWTSVMAIAHRRDRFERACEAGEHALALRRAQGDTTLIADAMMNLAVPTADLRDYERALVLYEECLALQRAANNRRGLVLPLLNLGSLHYQLDRPREALAHYQESLAASREVGQNEWARALAWNGVGEVRIVLDEPERAIEAVQDAHRQCIQEHDPFGTAICAFTLGRAEWRTGAVADAGAHLDDAERIFRELGNPVMGARVRYVRASLALDLGDAAAARRDLTQAIADLSAQPRPSDYVWWIIERVGTLVRQQGHMEDAARLCAAGITGRAAVPGPMEPDERELRVRDAAALCAALGAGPLAAAAAAGRALTLDGALALARQVLAAGE
ncbi:MAG TPA: tetratricopeptide repeat protein [Ktedonobacterales bacterium]|jgi:predicted ATPase/transcriptional regulator with XRE-family HTH domain